MSVTEDQVWAALQWVIDPELGLNIVEMGLVYGVEVRDGHVRVEMTTTTPACPLNVYLSSAAEAMIRQMAPEAQSVTIRLVWEPRWEPAMMTDEARQYMGWA